MIYHITDAFSDAFSIFMLIDYNKDERPIIVTSKVKEIESYKELYLKYFNSEYFVNTKIKLKPENMFEDCITPDGNPIFKMSHLFVEACKDKSIFEKKNWFSYSLASNAHTYKGMDNKMMDHMKQLLSQGIDLGDSRNFDSFEDMEKRFLTLCQSKYFIGSEVSWAIFCTFFQIECMQLFQLWPYKSTKRAKFGDLTFSIDPHMKIGDIET